MLSHHKVLSFLLRAAFAALGMWLASALFKGLQFDTAQTLVLAALLLGVVNAVVRPLVLILTLPLTIVTLGFFLLVVNAAMLGLVSVMVEGFRINGFWTAVGASLVITVCSWGANALLGGVRIEVKRID